MACVRPELLDIGMFWQRNRLGLMLVMLAMAFVAGEVAGFAVPHMSGLWPWAAVAAINLVAVAVGWSLRHLRWVVAALVGLSLAWQVESERLRIDNWSRVRGEGGKPPEYELDVEGGVFCRKHCAGGCMIVGFDSSLGSIPVQVIAKMDDAALPPVRGERWRCAGWLSLKKSAPNRYAKRTLWVMEDGHMARVAKPRRISSAAYRKFSLRLARYAGTGLGWAPELADMGKAMLLGQRGRGGAVKREKFAAAGTMHVFAISGLHVMLVTGMLCLMLSKVGLSIRMRSACAIPALAAYVMMSGVRPSAVRAAFMAGLWLCAGLFGRKPDGLAAWGIAAIAVYGFSPAIVFNAGCALSFVVMLGILLWLRWSAQFAAPLDWMLRLSADEQAVGCAKRRDVILKWHGIGMGVLGALGISFAAWIASAPIVARVFGRITVGGIFANVVVVPLAAIAVTLGAVGTAASVVAEPLGALLNNLSAASIWIMEAVSELVAACPFASFETLPWSWTDCGLWYVAWIALFAVLARHLPRREDLSVRSW